jgi:hypothetical protein
MTSSLPAVITSLGLLCDIAGALLVANEVVRVFKGPAAIDVGDAGCINGGTHIVPRQLKGPGSIFYGKQCDPGPFSTSL